MEKQTDDELCSSFLRLLPLGGVINILCFPFGITTGSFSFVVAERTLERKAAFFGDSCVKAPRDLLARCLH